MRKKKFFIISVVCFGTALGATALFIGHYMTTLYVPTVLTSLSLVGCVLSDPSKLQAYTAVGPMIVSRAPRIVLYIGAACIVFFGMITPTKHVLLTELRLGVFIYTALIVISTYYISCFLWWCTFHLKRRIKLYPKQQDT